MKMTNEQRQEMFQDALKWLVFSIRMKNPEDMRERWLTSTFAHHMMKAEGRKQVYFTSPALHRWVTKHHPELNEVFTEFWDWLTANETDETAKFLN